MGYRDRVLEHLCSPRRINKSTYKRILCIYDQGTINVEVYQLYIWSLSCLGIVKRSIKVFRFVLISDIYIFYFNANNSAFTSNIFLKKIYYSIPFIYSLIPVRHEKSLRVIKIFALIRLKAF